MSQKTVERLIGKLATDEEARSRYRADRRRTLEELAGGTDLLSAVELDALAATSADLLDSFADALDPRLQRVRLPREPRPEGRP
ncbi:MAG: hypothetical protein EDX89_10890 [Acidobacteria bacterium]|nr:MAG: hypothetical protein EDX89_10890 [Acidobacteriota bacterium]MCE7959015.1 hypothetical protein [Acidobacteria bacterium ACB2]